MQLFRTLNWLAVAVVMAASTISASAQSMVDEVVQRGTLRVGMSTFVPWAMRDKKGELIGFEVDVAKKVAKDMGVEIELVPTQWSGIIPALLAKKFDIIIGGLSITPERNLTINFTIPYAHSGQQMASNTALTKDMKSLDQYNDAAVTIACRRGSVSCDAARKLFPKATLRQFDDDAQAFQEVVNGNAHALISSAPKPRFWSDAYPDKVYVANNGENLTRGDEAFGLRRGDVDSLNFFSNWILVNTSNGWLQETHDYWFKDQSAWKDMVAAE
ncbi:MAG: transporter substrate-binding domain-containing protein [Parvibaculaceae bacterium]